MDLKPGKKTLLMKANGRTRKTQNDAHDEVEEMVYCAARSFACSANFLDTDHEHHDWSDQL